MCTGTVRPGGRSGAARRCSVLLVDVDAVTDRLDERSAALSSPLARIDAPTWANRFHKMVPAGLMRRDVAPRSTPRCSHDTLTDADRARLELFDAHPRLRAGWQALQELHGLYTADDYDGALEALGRFCDLYETGELPEYHDTVDTFIAWSDEILNWHHTGHPSNGRIEGTNNLLQVLRRSAHGFTNPRNFEARGILVT